ncbi:3',5'-cyclic-nucleotide phosphodiesterase [Lysinibacillus contaminans]|uniref:3',5'-cyclic-nucleotide phosphodiesterase n=1 Tax=Lysinibacillus contaminans TaxID=1293441 RepID=A0ABR5K2J3_9BACI|nr:cyclically-permuted mutarotase family protein [Lysinibacillus contaminans]KOS69103.1 3',5'-cyclic-nucleotide phosphodiesterase [Lysinibacillus contaminans]
MKKFWIAAITSIFVLSGGTMIKANASEVEKSIEKIVWEHAGELEAQKGFDKNIGTAGVLSGSYKDYVIVGGGANFPYETVLNGGAKKHYSDIYVLKKDKNKLTMVEHTNLNHEIGYGSSVTTEEGVYYIGGSPEKEYADDITLLTVGQNKKLKVSKIGDLPFTISDGVAAESDGKLYIGLGKQNGKESNKLYEYDLKTSKTRELAPIPGETVRNQSVAQILDGNLYVFSGGGSVAYTDGYKYNIEKNKWSKVSSVKVGKKEISLLGANSVKLNKDEMMVIGGFNKEIYDHAVKNLGSLQGEGLLAFRTKYFNTDPVEFNWNKDILIYNAKKDTWRSVGKIPFDAPCGEGLVLMDKTIYSINGEIKPGVRTNAIYSGTILYN